MLVTVELWAFENGEPRQVDVPDSLDDIGPNNEQADIDHLLENVFHWGQNERQEQELPSVSMGDVALLWGKRYLCCSVGWKELTQKGYDYYTSLPQEERTLYFVNKKHQQKAEAQ